MSIRSINSYQPAGEYIVETGIREVSFALSSDSKPVVATYGCNPIIGVGGYDSTNQLAFIVTFIDPNQVACDGASLITTMSKLAQKTLKEPIQLHLRGGCPGLSEETIQAVESWATRNKMVIASRKVLFPWESDESEGTSLYIDSRNGAIGEYTPLQNPYHRVRSYTGTESELQIGYLPELPSSPMSIHSLLKEKIHLTWNARAMDYNPYFGSFDILKNGIARSETLQSMGHCDITAAGRIQQVMGFLSCRLPSHKKDALPALELNSYDTAVSRFNVILDAYIEFLSVMNSDQCPSHDTTEDHLIQRVNHLFHYERPSPKKLIVVVDRTANYTPRLSSAIDKLFNWENAPGTNYVYITDPIGRKWRATGVPIGKRALTRSIEALEILVKKTKKSGEVVIQSVFTTLPDQIKKSVLNFMKEGRPNSEFVCFSFVEMLQKEMGEVEYSLFTSEKELSPGDSICLTSAKREETTTNLREFVANMKSHYALYLGHKLYLSIFGGTGPLQIGTLPLMMQCQGYQDIIVMKTRAISTSFYSSI